MRFCKTKNKPKKQKAIFGIRKKVFADLSWERQNKCYLKKTAAKRIRVKSHFKVTDISRPVTFQKYQIVCSMILELLLAN